MPVDDAQQFGVMLEVSRRADFPLSLALPLFFHTKTATAIAVDAARVLVKGRDLDRERFFTNCSPAPMFGGVNVLTSGQCARDGSYDVVANTVLACEECDATATASATAFGWEAHLADVEEDGQDDVVVYCPRCAFREFHADEFDRAFD